MSAASAPSRASAPRPLRRELIDLVSSMRFAIALLTVICIASAIGTVVKQGEPLASYVDQFGPFWAEVFGTLGLFRVYSSPWFLVILAFLVTSTSLCLVRNVPKILLDWRSHKEGMREQALQAFHHKASGRFTQPLDAVQAHVERLLELHGWSVKMQQRQASARGEAGVMLGARYGAANKLGYIAAHSAIVLVCVGGLLDGDLIVKLQAWSQGLKPFRGGTETAQSRLSEANPAYRAQLFVPEGQRSNAAVITMDQGMLVQPLPFEVELKKFSVDYYTTGMPKRFASEVVIHDARRKVDKAFTVEVNHPVTYEGVTIFQSGFEDGGSAVHLQPVSLLATRDEALPLIASAVGGEARPLPAPAGTDHTQAGLSLEVTGLRVINVEDLAQAQSPSAADASNTDVRGVNLAELSKHLGSGAKGPGDKKLSNIGPAVTYKLRDAAGQAREYQNYMAPVNLGGPPVFLLGVRDTPAEGFRYLRAPADDDLSLQGWVRLRHALNNADLRREAAQRFGRTAAPADKATLQQELAVSAQRALDVFAGAIPVKPPPGADKAPADMPSGGLQALSNFIEQVVPADQRERSSGTLIHILNGAMFELWNISREHAGLAPRSVDDEAARGFMTQAVLSLSDAVFYPAPMILLLDSFEQKQASVFQVTRTPGRNVVYLGCVLLAIGVLAMLYIRERRVWVWLQDDGQGGTRLRTALSTTRHTLDVDREFNHLRDALLTGAVDEPPAATPTAPPAAPASDASTKAT